MIIRHDVEPQLYVASSEQFAAVVMVASHLEEVFIGYDTIDQLLKPQLLPEVQTKPEFILCADGMGCLIRPNWILTAAHVAATLPEHHEIKIGNKAHEIQKVVLHPKYVCSEHMGSQDMANPQDIARSQDISQVQNDIALIQLTHAVEKVAPLALYSQPDELKQVMTLVGRGDSGVGLIGPDRADGKLRKATNRVEKVSEELLMFKFDTPPDCTELEGVCGPGDRGGPALLKVGNDWAIAGISADQVAPKNASLTSWGEGRYGVWEYYTRVSYHLDWIRSVVACVRA